MSHQLNSIEKFLESNSVKVPLLKLSPINITKYNPDIFSFANNVTPIRPLPIKPLFEAPFFSLSPHKVHETNTQSSIFSQEEIIQKAKPLNLIKGKIISINQLIIMGSRLLYFPIIHDFTERDLNVNIIKPLQDNIHITILEQEEVNFDFYIKDNSLSSVTQEKFVYIKNECEIDNEITIENIKELIKYLFEKLRYTIHSIQLNFILQKKKYINENLLLACQTLIDKINRVVENILTINTKEIMKSKQTLKKPKSFSIQKRKILAFHHKEVSEDFTCNYCNKKFSNGCALGGHMSRVHPHKSEQYKQKQKIRERRNEYREAIKEAKEKIWKKHYHIYSNNKNQTKKEKKEIIKRIIKMNRKEYMELLKKCKLEKGLIG